MNIEEIKMLTPHRDVNKVLAELTDGLTNLLGDQLVGLYLTGSLTYGDFDRGSSDIDFLVVLKNELSDSRLEDVTSMHKRIAESVPFWTKRLEGSYITEAMIALEKPKKTRPYINAGKVSYCVYGNEWTINLYALQESGIALVGPEPKDIFPYVDVTQVRDASIEDLKEDWLPKADDPNAFNHPLYGGPHSKAYAVLTMCRILYRVKNDGIASKRVASTWVKQTYGKPWGNLVEQAEQWQHGKPMASDELVKDFIRFTFKETSQLQTSRN